jgi:4-amino-4-deoxy-L-arabinose transferase-like glycosyltransferase
LSPEDPKRHARRLAAPLAIFLLAFLARMAFSVAVAGFGAPPRDDASQYDSIARSLATGGDFTVGAEGFRATRAPAYPFLLAGVYWLFGAHWAVGQVAQAFLGAMTCWLLYLLGSRLIDQRLGLLAGVTSALDPY